MRSISRLMLNCILILGITPILGQALVVAGGLRTVGKCEPCWTSSRQYMVPDVPTNEDEHVELDSVSDTEALLACRAYLQRKNRLGGWTEGKRRKDMLRQASAIGSTFSSASVGYFWEDPSELLYLNNPPRSLQDQFEDIPDSPNESDSPLTDSERVIFDQQQSVTLDDEVSRGSSALERGGEFTSFPFLPSESRVRRSNAAKKTWSNPEWKAKWYQKRWGGGQRKRTPQQRRDKKLEIRMRSFPPTILSSPELASLTEDEINEAIQTYVLSNRKRSKARTKTDPPKSPEPNPTLDEPQPRIDFFSSNEVMREAQQKRSERATKAYQTRVANETKYMGEKKRTSKPMGRVPTSNTPRDALVRIHAALEAQQLPSVADVKLILKPPKLGHRKELLRRILFEHFGLRGKCVPVESLGNDPTSSFLFATQCSIEELGNFVVSKLEEQANACAPK